MPNVRTWNHKVDKNGVIECEEGDSERENIIEGENAHSFNIQLTFQRYIKGIYKYNG